MNNLIQALFNSIKSKILPIWTRIKMWTNWSFIQTKMVTFIRTFFTKILDIRPKHKKDYYTISRWMISKRLAFAIVLSIGVFSLFYIIVINPPSIFTQSGGDGIKTYAYNSLPLRFAKGVVRIKGQSGYLAYEGNVEKGQVTGMGTLYDIDGFIVYTGQFEANKYCGVGKEYYPGQQLWYSGEFVDNLFEGNGTLYRRNGSLEYVGSFGAGLKEGSGILYNSGSNQIFEGTFSADHIVYEDFLGKTTQEAGKTYTGEVKVYSDEENYVIGMEEINALYYGKTQTDNLEDTIAVEGVYVLDNIFYVGGKAYTKISELEKHFGALEYEGNTNISLADAVAINTLRKTKASAFDEIETEIGESFSNVWSVESFDSEYQVYIYVFQTEDTNYTFFSHDRNGVFEMYLIEK